jgi:hypothetical protein
MKSSWRLDLSCTCVPVHATVASVTAYRGVLNRYKNMLEPRSRECMAELLSPSFECHHARRLASPSRLLCHDLGPSAGAMS